MKTVKRTMAALVAAMAVAAAAIVPASASASIGGPPECTQGQFQAAAAQFNGNSTNFQQVIKHGAYGIACLVGVPPGQLNNS